MASVPLEAAAENPPVPIAAEPAPARVETDQRSYGQILKSSAWIGGSSLINIAIGVVRTKATAILLGPAGFGLNGVYSSIADVAQSLAGMGINSSGVRQIAESAGSGDEQRIASTAAVLRRISVILGVLGAALLALFSRPVSTLTFGTPQHAGAVCLLSLAVLFKLVSNGQTAWIQGMRRISDLARVNVAGAAGGVVLGIPLIYFFRERGIVPALIAVAGATSLASWWYSRKLRTARTRVTLRQIARESEALLKLGFAFMVSGFLTMGAAYTIRILLLHRAGVVATGYYQSAWTLGGLYVGIILQAMGADFYPRLTAQANDHPAANRLINEQTHAGLLLAAPGVLATLAFAPLVLAVFYSARFHAAAGILRWLALGTLLQVISWPMGFIVLAKGRQNLFLLSEIAWAAVYLALASISIRAFGLEGAGIAFFGAYLFHAFLNYAIARSLSGFVWSPANRRTTLVLLPVTALVFTGFYLLPQGWAIAVGALAFAAIALYSMATLLASVAIERIPGPLGRLLVALAAALERGGAFGRFCLGLESKGTL